MSVRPPFRFLLVLGAVLLLKLTACSQTEPATPPQAAESSQHQLVGPEAFAEALLDPQRIVINVHAPDEGSIRGTDLAIPFDRMRARADELPAGRATGLAVYCMSGNMSETAVEALTDMGYVDVIELRRGMEAWERSGRPLLGADL